MACTPACDSSNETLASSLNNFIAQFFGSVTKSCVDGQVVWTLPCDLANGMACYPRQANEGVACYILRLFDLFGLVASGAWDVNVQYCKNAFVTYGGQGYVALGSTIGQQPDLFPGSWFLYVAQGAVGPPGTSPLTTKGDVFGFDTGDARIPVGADNTALMADSTTALGVRWGFPPSSDLAANLGAGNGVFALKAGNIFQFKSLIAGTNITIVPTGTDLTINSSAGGGGGFIAGFTSTQQTLTPSSTLTLAHGLGVAPILVQFQLVNTVGEGGYAAGDIAVDVSHVHTSLGGTSLGLNALINSGDVTNVVVLIGTGIQVARKDTQALFDINMANWDFFVRAWS